MKVLVVGSGGREHALAWKLSESDRLEEASCSHVAAVSQLFGERFDDDELESLASLLGRLPGADGDPEACTAGGGQDSGE